MNVICSENKIKFFTHTLSGLGEHLSDDLSDSRRIRCPPEYNNVIIPRNESTETSNLEEVDRIIPIYRNAYAADTGTSGNLPRSLVKSVL